jgi:hypothetical protein
VPAAAAALNARRLHCASRGAAAGLFVFMCWAEPKEGTVFQNRGLLLFGNQFGFSFENWDFEFEKLKPKYVMCNH